MYLGDFNFGSTVFFKFTTVNSSGVPTALSSAGVTAYRDGSTVQDTTGLTLTSTFDAIVGLNMVQVDMSTAGFYSSGGSYTVILSSGAASENLTGYTLAHFSLRDRFVLSTAGLETVSTAGLETLSSAGLETLSTLGITTLSSAGLETLSSAGLETLSTLGITTLSSAGLETLSTVGIETLSTVGLETVSTVGLETVSTVGLETVTAAVINAEVLDVLDVDTFAVPTDLPSTLPTITGMMGYQHGTLRNQLTLGASAKTFYDPAGNVQWVKGLLDDGTTYVELVGSTST